MAHFGRPRVSSGDLGHPLRGSDHGLSVRACRGLLAADPVTPICLRDDALPGDDGDRWPAGGAPQQFGAAQGSPYVLFVNHRGDLHRQVGLAGILPGFRRNALVAEADTLLAEAKTLAWAGTAAQIQLRATGVSPPIKCFPASGTTVTLTVNSDGSSQRTQTFP